MSSFEDVFSGLFGKDGALRERFSAWREQCEFCLAPDHEHCIPVIHEQRLVYMTRTQFELWMIRFK